MIFKIDDSVELLEKVQNNNSASNGEKIIDIVQNNSKIHEEVGDYDVKEHINGDIVDLPSLKSKDFSTVKSVRQQVEDLAKDQGLDTLFKFLNPSGYVYNIGYVV